MRHYAPHQTNFQTWTSASAGASAHNARAPKLRHRFSNTLSTILSGLSISPRPVVEPSSERGMPSCSPRDDLHMQPRLSALHRWLNISAPLPPTACRALRTLMRSDAIIVRTRAANNCVVCSDPRLLRNLSEPPPQAQWFRGDSFIMQIIAFLCFGIVLLLGSLLQNCRRIHRTLRQRQAVRLRRECLMEAMQNASCYSAWHSAAAELDHLDGHTAWMTKEQPTTIENLCMRCDSFLNTASRIRTRSSDVSRVRDDLDTIFNVEMLTSKLHELAKLYHRGDVKGLAFALRASLVRNFSGMCHPRLHAHSRVGTDLVLEDYVHVVSYLLAYVAQADVTGKERGDSVSVDRICPPIVGSHDVGNDMDVCKENHTTTTLTFDDKLAFLNEARHAYGRTALMLSGGATMGLHHFGVVKSLLGEDLLPRVVCGTSAGALVASIVGILNDEELATLFSSEEFVNPLTKEPFSFRFFHESSIGSRMKSLLRNGYIEDVAMLQETLRHNYGDVTFEEAYNKTGRILNITVCPTRTSSDPPLLLNYLTAPHVLIWSAASASCAIPVLFAGVELVAKSASGRQVAYHPDGVRWMDGSITSDVPLARIGELFNVNHFIVSQTNPHVIPRSFPILHTRIALLIKSELQFRYWQALHMGLVPRVLTAIFPHFMQPYAGDVTIMPDVRLADLPKLFSNPTSSLVQTFLKRGELQTYPYIDCVRLHCSIERALDKCVECVGRMPKVDPEGSLREEGADSSAQRGLFGRVPSWLWLDTRSILSGSRMGAVGAMASRLTNSRQGDLRDLKEKLSTCSGADAGIGAEVSGDVKEVGGMGSPRLRRAASTSEVEKIGKEEGANANGNAGSSADGVVDALVEALEKDVAEHPVNSWVQDVEVGYDSDGRGSNSGSGEEGERVIC